MDPLTDTPGPAAGQLTELLGARVRALARRAMLILRGRSQDIPAGSRTPLGEEHRELLAALHLLPGLQREAVVLRYCLGLPEDEAAQAMGVSRDTVKSASHRGLADLARLLTRPPSPWPLP